MSIVEILVGVSYRCGRVYLAVLWAFAGEVSNLSAIVAPLIVLVRSFGGYPGAPLCGALVELLKGAPVASLESTRRAVSSGRAEASSRKSRATGAVGPEARAGLIKATATTGSGSSNERFVRLLTFILSQVYVVQLFS